MLIAAAALALGAAGCAPGGSGPNRLAGFKNVRLPESLTADTADLTIEGNIKRDGPVHLDLSTIRSMPVTSFETHDPWDKKTQKYTGVLLVDLLDYIGLEESAASVEVTAANDYKVPIRISDLRRYDYLLAYMIDDVLLTENDGMVKKGKLMVEINFAKHKDMDVETYKNQLVWQTIAISVR